MNKQSFFILISKKLIATDVKNLPNVTNNTIYRNDSFIVEDYYDKKQHIFCTLMGMDVNAADPLNGKSIQRVKDNTQILLIQDFLKSNGVINYSINSIALDSYKFTKIKLLDIKALPSNLFIIDNDTKDHYFINTII